MSKKLLYESLKEQYDLNRLQRIDKRRRNKKISKRLYHDDLDDEEIELNEVNLSSSSSSTTTSTRRRAAAPTTVVSSSETKTKLRKKIRLSCQSKCDNDDIDPIMRIPLGKHIFTFIRPNGSSTRFNVESLIDYMLETGDFTDPSSRLSFSDDDLKMIDKIVSYSL